MQVMDAIAEILKREGISTLFCFPTTPIIEAAVAAGIRPIICRQERVGVHMADGFARVATAYSDSSPVLFLPLGHPRETAQLFPMFKSSRTYASVTKSVEEMILPDQVGHVMRRAFSALKNGRGGPVMVEIPTDVVGFELGDGPLDYRPVRAARAAGDPRDIDEAARLLIEARCPMILAGQGILYAEATPELV